VSSPLVEPYPVLDRDDHLPDQIDEITGESGGNTSEFWDPCTGLGQILLQAYHLRTHNTSTS